MEDKIPFQGDVTQAYWDSPAEAIVPRNNKYLAWIKEHKLFLLPEELKFYSREYFLDSIFADRV